MYNIIKADVKKIKRSKSVWLMPLIILGVTVMVCGLFAGLRYIMELDTSSIMGDSADSAAALVAFPSTGYDMTLTNLQSDTLIYTLIIVFLTVSAFDFSSGTVKNLLAIGKSKKVIYTSKLVTSYAWTLCAVIFYALVSVFLGYAFFASTPTLRETGNISLIVLKQIPIYLSIISIGHMLVFATQRVAPCILIYIGSFILFETVAPIIDMMIESSFKVSWLMPLYQLVELTNLNASSATIITVYISCAVCLGLTVTGGYFIFKRSELK